MSLDWISTLWEWIVPPLDADPQKQYAHRLRTAATACAAFVLVILLALGVYGLLPNAAGNLAKESEVVSLKSDVDARMATVVSDFNKKVDTGLGTVTGRMDRSDARSISVQLITLQISHCLAKGKTKDDEWQLIQEFMDKYQELTGRPYELAKCSDL